MEKQGSGFWKKLDLILKAVLVLLTVALFVIVGYNVIRRFIFNNSIAWADELSRYIFIWVNLLGMIFVFHDNEVIRLELFSSRLKKFSAFFRVFLPVVEFLITSIVLGVLFYFGFKYFMMMRHVSATLALPMKLIYAILPLSMGVMFIDNIVKVIIKIKNMGGELK